MDLPACLLYFWAYPSFYFLVFLFLGLHFFSCRFRAHVKIASRIVLAVKTASEMTYIVSSGALNSTPTNQPTDVASCEVHVE